MMKLLSKIFLYLIVFFIAMLVLLPKQSLYFALEKQLEKQKVIISDEKVKPKFFGLELNKANIYFEQINIANIEKLDFSSYVFHTQIKAYDIKFLDSFETMLPSAIQEVVLTHNFLDFKKVKIEANSSYGVLEGFIDLFEKKVYLELQANSKMKRNYGKLLRKMKLKDGRYIYEYKY